MNNEGYLRIPCIDENPDLKGMPPCTREVWFYILRKVSPKNTEYLKKGTGEFVLKDVREDLSWLTGFRKEYYSIKQIAKAFEKLKTAKIIDFENVNDKGNHYKLVIFLKYELYEV